MSTVRMRSVTTALTAPPSWPILTRRSTAVSDGEMLTVRDRPRADRRAQSRRYDRPLHRRMTASATSRMVVMALAG